MAPRWTKEEDKTLMKHYQNHTRPQLTELFPGRTEAGVSKRISVLNLSSKARPWTSQDEKELTHLVKSGMDTEGIMEQMNRTESAIMHKKSTMGLSRLTGHKYILAMCGVSK